MRAGHGPSMSGMGVQQRLTVAFVVLAAGLVTILGAVEVAQLSGFLADGAGVRIRAQARPTIDRLLAPDEDGAPADIGPVAEELARDLTSAGTGAAVLAGPRQVLAFPPSDLVGALPPPVGAIPDEAIARALGGALDEDVTLDTGDGRILIALVPVPAGTTPQAVVALVTSLVDEDAVVTRQALIAVLNVVLAAVVGAVAGPPLIRRALSPLRDVASATRDIAAGDLSRRVAHEGPDDEIGALATSFDVMADGLERAFADMADSEQRMRDFVGDASHELRTPLTALGGFADVLLRGSADPVGARRLLEGLRREVDRMHRLVDDLLLLARLDAGAPLERRPVDVADLARSVAADLEVLAGDRRLEVTGSGTASGDADRLRQVLLNLMSNAIRHTEESGHVRVVVDTDEEGVAVHVTVADDGEGMDEDLRRRALDRFARGNQARRGAGAGLGLAIVARIIEAHRGAVAIDSVVGQGTTVSVTVPRHAAHDLVQGSDRTT